MSCTGPAGCNSGSCRGYKRAAAAVRAEAVGALLIAEEALGAVAIDQLRAVLEDQPGWSDLPVLILVSGGRETLATRRLEEELISLPNIALLERPVRPTTLISSVKAALRSRERQYEVRNTIAERDRALARCSRASSKTALSCKARAIASSCSTSRQISCP